MSTDRAPNTFTVGKTAWVRFTNKDNVYFYAKPFKTDRDKIWQEKEDPKTGKVFYYHWASKTSLFSFSEFPDYVTLAENGGQTPTTPTSPASPTTTTSSATTPVSTTPTTSANTTPSTTLSENTPPSTTPSQTATTSVSQIQQEEKKVEPTQPTTNEKVEEKKETIEQKKESIPKEDTESKTDIKTETKQIEEVKKDELKPVVEKPKEPVKEEVQPKVQEPIPEKSKETKPETKIESVLEKPKDPVVETQPIVEQPKPTVTPKEEQEPKDTKQKKTVIVEDDPKQKKKSQSTIQNTPQNETQRPKSMTLIQGSSGSSGTDDFKDFSNSKRTLSFIGKRQSQAKVSFSKKDLAKTEFDDSIEDDLFVLPGRGEVHVHTAFKATYFATPKTKKDRIVILARDFVGAFCLFMAGQEGKNKKNTILAAYPLIDFFDINDDKDKINLSIDGNEFVFQASALSRERLKQGLEVAYSELESKSEMDLFNYRLSSIEFANSYFQQYIEVAPSAIIKTIMESDPNEIMDYSIQESSDTYVFSKFDQALRMLQMAAKNSNDRDTCMQEACAYMERIVKKLDKGLFEKFGRIWDVLFKYPTPTERPELRNNFLKVLNDIRLTKKIDSSAIDDIFKNGNDCFKAIQLWRSRAKLKEVPFGEEYQPSTQKSKGKKELQQEKLMRESIIQKKLPSGVFLGVLFFSKTGEILSDKNDNLPSMKLDRLMYHNENSKSLDHPDWQWLMKHGQSFTQIILDLVPSLSNPQVILDVFKTDFIRAFNDLYRAVNQSTKPNVDLGVLLDKCVTMKGQNILYYLMVKQVDKKEFEIPNGYKWDSTIDFEYRQYQKYENLDESFVIEKLESHYSGSRWVYNAMDYYKSITSKTYSDGLWLGYFNFKLTEKGSYQVLVEDKARFMIPTIKVADKYDVRKLRDLLANSFSAISSVTNINEDTPDYVCDTLEKQLFRAKLQLQQKIGKPELGHLFKSEIIEIGERTKVILFIDNDVTSQIGNEYNRVLWRDETSFEALHTSLFYPVLHEHYMGNIRKQLLFDNSLFNDSSTSSDEYLRNKETNNIGRLRELIRAEEAIYLIRWPHRVISSYLSIKQNNNSILQVINNGKEFAKLVFDQTIGKKKTFRDFRLELFKAQDSQEAEAKKLKEIESKSKVGIQEQDLEKSTCAVYDVDADIEDLRDIEMIMIGPSREEILTNLIEEEVEINIVDHLDRLELEAIRSTLDDVISIIEVTTDVIEYTIFEQKKEDSKDVLKEERVNYIQSVFSGIKLEVEDTENTPGTEEIEGYDSLYRQSIQLFDASMDNSLLLLHTIEKTQTMIDLVEVMFAHDENLEKQEKVVRSIQKIKDRQSEILASQPSYPTLPTPMHNHSANNSIQQSASQILNQPIHPATLQAKALINIDEEKLRILLEEEERKKTEEYDRKMRKYVQKATGFSSFSLPYGTPQQFVKKRPTNKPSIQNTSATTPSKMSSNSPSTTPMNTSTQEKSKKPTPGLAQSILSKPKSSKPKVSKPELPSLDKPTSSAYISFDTYRDMMGLSSYNRFLNQNNVLSNLDSSLKNYTEAKKASDQAILALLPKKK